MYSRATITTTHLITEDSTVLKEITGEISPFSENSMPIFSIISAKPASSVAPAIKWPAFAIPSLIFVATALPKITIENKTIIAVSPQSPLGSHMLGKEVGFTFKIHETQYVIEIVL